MVVLDDKYVCNKKQMCDNTPQYLRQNRPNLYLEALLSIFFQHFKVKK
jgi:hypothetical protein